MRPDPPQLKSTDASVLLKILRDFPLASAQVLSPWCPVSPPVMYPLISVCPQNILLLNLAEIMEYSSPFLVLPTFCLAFSNHLWHYFFWECPLTLRDLSLSFTVVQVIRVCEMFLARLPISTTSYWAQDYSSMGWMRGWMKSWNTTALNHVRLVEIQVEIQGRRQNQWTQVRQNCQSMCQERVSGKQRIKARDRCSRKSTDQIEEDTQERISEVLGSCSWFISTASRGWLTPAHGAHSRDWRIVTELERGTGDFKQ